MFLCVYLVRAPVPRGQYGEAQGHARPRQVSGDGVPEQVHGVLAWQVAGAVGNDFTGHCHAVHVLQVPKAANLVESCGWGRQTSHWRFKNIDAGIIYFFLNVPGTNP